MGSASANVPLVRSSYITAGRLLLFYFRWQVVLDYRPSFANHPNPKPTATAGPASRTP
jgi:hypothetical protein